MFRRVAAVIFLYCLIADVSVGADPSFEKDRQPWLQSHCIRCHGVEKQEGEFRIDTLSPEVGVKDTPHWAEIIERITSGEMPPKDAKNRPSADASAKIVEWLAARIKEGEAARMARRDRVSYYRLTRDEYVNSVRDLIGVEYDAADPGGLLEDPEWNGFERLGSVLTLSPTHIEKYMTAAEVVLAEAYSAKKVEYLELSRRAVEMQPGQPHYERLEQAGLLDKVRYPLTTAGITKGDILLFRISTMSPFVIQQRALPQWDRVGHAVIVALRPCLWNHCVTNEHFGSGVRRKPRALRQRSSTAGQTADRRLDQSAAQLAAKRKKTSRNSLSWRPTRSVFDAPSIRLSLGWLRPRSASFRFTEQTELTHKQIFEHPSHA
jgi:hypothetical protein